MTTAFTLGLEKMGRVKDGVVLQFIKFILMPQKENEKKNLREWRVVCM
jgi:hypothetical protein